jgi:RNA polymerase sigma factor (sigma-70 family)
MQITPELIESCVNDDRKAIEQLYKYCFRTLIPVCFRYHTNEEDARASLNSGFMKILKGLVKVDTKEFNFNAWSKRVMNNTLIDEYRKNKKYETKILRKETEWELDLYADTIENEVSSNLGYEEIMKLLEKLPVTTAKVFSLYVIDGYAHKEIGEILEVSEGTSKWHLSTARKMLREKLGILEEIKQGMVI